MVSAFHLENFSKLVLYENLPDLLANPAGLAAFRPVLEDAHLRAHVLTWRPSPSSTDPRTDQRWRPELVIILRRRMITPAFVRCCYGCAVTGTA